MSNIKLLYGTTNKAKISVMENAVKDLGIELGAGRKVLI